MSVFVVMEYSNALEKFSKANPNFAKMFTAEFGTCHQGGMIEVMKEVYQTTFDASLAHSKSKLPDHIRRPELHISVFTGACYGPHFTLFIKNTLTMIEKTEDSIVRDWDMDSEICNVEGLEGRSVRASAIAAGGNQSISKTRNSWSIVAGVAAIAAVAALAIVLARRKSE